MTVKSILITAREISKRSLLQNRRLLLSSKTRMGLEAFQTCAEKVMKGLKSESDTYTERKLRAAVLHGPRNFKLEYIPERAVRTHQIRVDVHFCGLTGCDVLLWTRKHDRVPEPQMVLGYEISGRILEMGRLAYEKTGYQRGEEVIVHNYPDCGGLAETCVCHYKDVFRLPKGISMENAAALVEDYFSSFLSMGRRARIQRDEYLLVNTSQSRSALAVIDLATRVFRAKAIVVCDNPIREKLCYDIGAVRVFNRAEIGTKQQLYAEVCGQKEMRVLIETEGGLHFKNVLPCLQHEGIIAFLSCAKKQSNIYLKSNHVMFTVSTENYKIADTLLYRETVEHLLSYQLDGKISPRISMTFGLHYVEKAFNYYVTTPAGKVLIDLKNRDRLPAGYENRDKNM